MQQVADGRFLTHQGSFLINIPMALSRLSESCCFSCCFRFSVVYEQDSISFCCCAGDHDKVPKYNPSVEKQKPECDVPVRCFFWRWKPNYWTPFFIILSRKHSLFLAEEVTLPSAIFRHWTEGWQVGTGKAICSVGFSSLQLWTGLQLSLECIPCMFFKHKDIESMIENFCGISTKTK